MTNWTIFLLHFVAAYCYIVSGAYFEENKHINRGVILLVFAIVLTITAAWI